MKDHFMNTNEPAGINVAAITVWLDDHIDGACGPYVFTPLAGGHSNLTYRVTDANDVSFVVRRPPTGSVLATAHDMSREWRAIAALHATPVPVPSALAFCADSSVIGAPFYVMGFVDGYVQHSIAQTNLFGSLERNKVSGRSIFQVLADLHAVDLDAVGLGEHGPREGYIERQLRRWYKQFTAMKHRELPAVDEVYQRLLDSLPNNPEVTVVHGDFRLGNCITGSDGHIAAVLDWEISTLGDPMADLAYLLNTWARPNNVLAAFPDSELTPTMADGFDEQEVLLQQYADASGRDVSNIGYYVAFNHWKTACIVQGVLARYMAGARGDAGDVDLDGFERSIQTRAAAAKHALDSLV
jgi:aminoglycoside phosphotransferase (APT) family kinase protein